MRVWGKSFLFIGTNYRSSGSVEYKSAMRMKTATSYKAFWDGSKPNLLGNAKQWVFCLYYNS